MLPPGGATVCDMSNAGLLFAQHAELGEQLSGLGLIPYWVLGGYLVLLLGLGLAGWLKSKPGEEDYYLSGRSQGWVVASLTIMATFFSSFALLGAPGMVYREGVVFALFSLNVPMAGICVYLLGVRIWKIGRHFGYVTPADMAADYYGSRVWLKLLIALTGFLYAIPYVVMQIQAGGILFEKLFPGIPTFRLLGVTIDTFSGGAVLLAIITMLYIMVGGMRSVAWTDVIQGIMLIAGMLVCGLAMLLIFDGPVEFNRRVTTELPASSLTVPGNSGVLTWTNLFTICTLAAAGSMIQPAQWMRYYAARSAGSLRRAALIFSLVLTACFILGVMLIGVAGQVLYPLTYSLSEPLAAEVSLADAPPELAQHVELVRDADAARAQLRWTWSGRGERQIDAEQAAALRALSEEPSYRAAVERLVEMAADPDVRPEVTAHRDVVDYNSILVVVLANDIPAQLGTFGAIFGSLVIVAIMAASMSTADSNLHALSAMATRDLYDPFIRPQASERERVWVGRLVIVAATAVAVVVVIVGSREAVRSRYDILTMIAQMGLMAIAFSSQLLPLAVDMCFLRKGTRAGVSAGLAAGLAGAFLMGPLFRMFVDALGDPAQLPAVLAWLPSLLSAVESLQGRVIIQGAAWGLLLNVPVFVVVSIFTRRVDPEKVAAYTKVLAQPAEETRAGLA